MSRIDSSSDLANLIRAQAAAQLHKRTTDAAKGVGLVARRPLGPVTGSTERGEATGILAGLSGKISALSAADPERRRKAFRLYLEAVLVQAFGEGLAGDRDFERLIDTVDAQMRGDAELRQDCDAAADELLAGKGPPLEKLPQRRR